MFSTTGEVHSVEETPEQTLEIGHLPSLSLSPSFIVCSGLKWYQDDDGCTDGA